MLKHICTPTLKTAFSKKIMGATNGLREDADKGWRQSEVVRVGEDKIFDAIRAMGDGVIAGRVVVALMEEALIMMLGGAMCKTGCAYALRNKLFFAGAN